MLTQRTPEELRAFCASRLTGYKQPRLVHLVTELPRNALGKVLRPQLEEWARAQRDGGETTSGRP